MARGHRGHILDHGRLRHPRALNAGVAYVYPFWHLDPWGIRAFSSIAEKTFDPASIPPGPARAFADRLRGRGYPGLQLETRVVPDEDHLTVYPAMLTRALLALFPNGSTFRTV